jgi:hypothetical protein
MTSGGTIRKLDRSTGALQWEWSTGFDSDGVLRSGRMYAVGDRLFLAEQGGITAFAPGVPPPLEDATIHGQLAVACGKPAGHEIDIGDAVISAGPDGMFTATVRARGVVAVRPVDALLDNYLDVELTGRRDYDLGLVEMSDCHGP